MIDFRALRFWASGSKMHLKISCRRVPDSMTTAGLYCRKYKIVIELRTMDWFQSSQIWALGSKNAVKISSAGFRFYGNSRALLPKNCHKTENCGLISEFRFQASGSKNVLKNLMGKKLPHSSTTAGPTFMIEIYK
jgi:hypothetical protein